MNVRRPTGADAAAVAELIAAYDGAYGAPTTTSVDELREEWVEVDLERDAWLYELDGLLAGYSCVFGRSVERLNIDGYVHPELTGRGVGSAILQLAEERARERGAARLHNATLYADERGRALFEAAGFAYVRSFLHMEIDLEAPPPAPVVPEGLRLVTPTEADDEAVHAAVEEAFLDHWEHVPWDFARWQRRHGDSDRSLWAVVRDGDEIVGAAVNDLDRHGSGWIGVLATRRPWRGRGVAQALLLHSFGEFWRRGQRQIQLAVDASNPTGAVRVYERVGMRSVWRADVYEKHLR